MGKAKDRLDVFVTLNQGFSMRRHVHLGSRAFPTLPNSVYNISEVEKLIKELHSVSVDVSNGDTHTVEKGHK
ncbi:hypothetical protein L1987_78329 [Smallanthus sonchifolius]|uniref:Uncharacterized protein n=1 Tax=Smallanthus sonchifolius TaxID=185202 RepID=A0ACB8ZCK9_9ASTR|nr:hypothetical protein L1987_78329 [Smallanthus sonchifolius]